jgi:hypothetical protein
MATVEKAPAAIQERLLEILRKVDRPGSICVSRDLPVTMPGLEVDGLGAIRLPLGESQARELIGRCSQAPYGKGTETLVDTNVRRVWELEPARFKLTNPKWDELVSTITEETRVALGLEESELAARLYKLLVYEKGSFFLSHRDGEKLDGMVATLVIGLPSPHKGGKLVITHEGKRHEVALAGAASGYELSFAAFYADCEHEVKPIREGYRLCLVYNLTVAGSRRKSGIRAPHSAPIITSISELLAEWPSTGGISKLAVTLEHQYTPEGLNISTLKGVDHARADVLFAAAELAGCAAHLALITRWQTGSAEGGDYGYSYGDRDYESWSYGEEDEEPDEEPDEGTGHEMGEIYEEGLSINHWSDREGNKIAFGEMAVDEAEIVSDRAPEDWDLGREEFEGYTGNAGMTLERWYHRAAVVIWPKEKNFEVLCDAGTDAAIAGIKKLVGRLKRARRSDQQKLKKECTQFASAIIKTWGPPEFSYHSYSSETNLDRSQFSQVLQELDDPKLMNRFLIEVVSKEGDIHVDKSFPSFCKRHGWALFQDSLTSVIDAVNSDTLMRNVSLLEALCLLRDKDVARTKLCTHLADHAVTALMIFDKKRTRDDWDVEGIERDALLASLVKSMISIESSTSLERLVDHTMSQARTYDLTSAHAAAIFALESGLGRVKGDVGPVVKSWLRRCRAEFEKRTEHAPTPPADFRRPAKLSCTCPDCRELSEFLANPLESTHRFPVRKERRRHLHQIIDSNDCDLTHKTLRVGSPQTLICTKTTASYQKACEIFSRDQANLKRLRAIETKINRAAKR